MSIPRFLVRVADGSRAPQMTVKIADGQTPAQCTLRVAEEGERAQQTVAIAEEGDRAQMTVALENYTLTPLPDVASATRLLDLQADALVLSDGAAVSTWADASGLAHDFTQSGGARPTYHTGGGTPYVTFDGVDDWMLGPDFADNLASFTVFTLVRFDALSNYMTPIAKMASLSTGAGWAFFGGGVMYVQEGGGNTYYERDPVASDYGTDELWVGEKVSNTELHVYRNGALNDYDPPSTNGTIANFSTAQPVELARFNTGVPTYTPMRAYAVMIYAPAPNSSDRAAIEAWLSDKYGV